MKILIVSQYFYPESFRINGLAEALKARGFDVTVLTGQPNYPRGKIFEGYSNLARWRDRYKSIEILRVPIVPRKSGSNISLLLNYCSFVISACFFGLPRVSRPDVCLVWSSSPITSALPAILYGAFTGTPVALWAQDLWPESFSAITKIESPVFLYPLKKLVQFIYRHCKQIWIQSEAFTDSVLSHGEPKEKIHYLPNWAEDFYDRNHPTSVVRQSNTDENLKGFSIVFAGNMGKAQALPTVIEAAQKLRHKTDLHWYFVGDGSMKDWLQKEIYLRDLESQVHILDARSPEEMPTLFLQAKALLVSLAEDSIFDLTVPSKIQSYLASGKPVLASLNGEGARLIAESGSGLVAPAGDANGLAENVIELLKFSDEQRDQMGQRAYALFTSRFRMRDLVDRAESLLSSMMGSP